MNRNIENDITEFTSILKDSDNSEGLKIFSEIFTEPELETLSKRLRILKMLSEGKTQREVARILQVSLCKVTRGAKILKNSKSIITKYIGRDYYGRKV